MNDWSRFNDQFRETHAERTKRLRASYRKQLAAQQVGPNPWGLCSDCPHVDYPTDETRCGECPRRQAAGDAANKRRGSAKRA